MCRRSEPFGALPPRRVGKSGQCGARAQSAGKRLRYAYLSGRKRKQSRIFRNGKKRRLKTCYNCRSRPRTRMLYAARQGKRAHNRIGYGRARPCRRSRQKSGAQSRKAIDKRGTKSAQNVRCAAVRGNFAQNMDTGLKNAHMQNRLRQRPYSARRFLGQRAFERTRRMHSRRY